MTPKRKTNKVWVLSEYFYPEETPTSFYITEIAKHFANNEKDTNVICSTSSINIDVNCRKYEQYEGINIFRVKSPNLNKDKLFQRLIKLLITSITMTFKAMMKVKKNDIVFVATNPAFILLFMPLVKWFKRNKYYIIVHDVFPENLIVVNENITKSFIYKILKLCFNSAYSSADCCLTIGRDMSEVLLEKTKGKANCVCINIWSDNILIKPQNKNCSVLYKSLRLDDRFVLEFAGNFGKAQGIELLLKAAILMKNTNVHFLFIGDGVCRSLIEETIEKHKINNISLIGYQKRENQTDFLNACDVAIVALKKNMYGLGVPSKAYNYMAAGKPILFIGDENSEIDRCIKDFHIGYSVHSNSPEDLVKVINHIQVQKEELKLQGRRARFLAENIYSKENILNKFLEFC